MALASENTSVAQRHASWDQLVFHEGWFSPPVLQHSNVPRGVLCLSGVAESRGRSVPTVMWEWRHDYATSAWKPVVAPSCSVSGDWCNLFPHVVGCGLLPVCETDILWACPRFLLLCGTSVPFAELSPVPDLVPEAVVESNFRRSYTFLKLNVDLVETFLSPCLLESAVERSSKGFFWVLLTSWLHKWLHLLSQQKPRSLLNTWSHEER